VIAHYIQQINKNMVLKIVILKSFEKRYIKRRQSTVYDAPINDSAVQSFLLSA
jgi:hypothetical protein